MSIRLRIILFTVALLAPAVLATVILVQQSYKRERVAFEDRLRDTARAVSLALDRQIGQGQAILETLATSHYLATGEFGAFDRQARQAVRGEGRWVVLLDHTAQQLVNTRVPWGTPLPQSPWTALGIDFVPRAGEVTVSNLFKGSVAQLPVFFLHLRMPQEGGHYRDLSITMLASTLDRLIADQRLPPGWIGTILDQNGVVASRTRDAERFVGNKATPDLLKSLSAANEGTFESVSLDGVRTVLAFSRAPAYGWSIVIAVPVTEVVGEAHRRIAWTAIGSLVLLALGIGLAVIIGGRIARPIERLERQAAALGRGETVPIARSGLREADEVGSALRVTGEKLARGREELTAALHDVERQSGDLRRALAEKDVLLREVHHRVKNNLQMMASMVRIAGKAASQESQPMLQDISRRIVTIGQVYNQVYQADDLGRLDLAVYLQAICDQTTGALALGNIHLRTTLEPFVVDIDTAVPVGLIASELVTNALKHAFPDGRRGEIVVELERRGAFGVLTVCDDGVGLPETERGGATGLVLLKALAGQVDGRLRAKARPGGARFRLTFRIQRGAQRAAERPAALPA